MNEKFLASEEIENNLKKNKHRIVFGILFYFFCATFGLLFFFGSLIFSEPEFILIIAFPTFIISFFFGLFILVRIGLCSMRVNSYFNRIAPLNLNHISLNPKNVLSKKDEIYILYLAPDAGVYFIESNITGGQSLLDQKPKELPRSFIWLNKKTLEGSTFRIKEFSGFFKIPFNEKEYVNREAKVLYMPFKTVFKVQGKTEHIYKMLEYVRKRLL